jgi:hypothetical protein
VPRASQTDQRCGQGSGCAACVACGSSLTCDTSVGQCTTGPGLDGGLPPFPDGGFATCVTGGECNVGECCYQLFGLGGVCAGIGNPNLLGGTTCGLSRMLCGSTCTTGQACISGTCF